MTIAVDAEPCLTERYPDIEDFKICAKNCDNCERQPCLNKIFIEFTQDVVWVKLYLLRDVLNLFKLIGSRSYRLVAGNTGKGTGKIFFFKFNYNWIFLKGVYPITPNIKYWIDVRNIQELTTYSVGKSLILGGNITLSDTMEIIKEVCLERGFEYLEEIHRHFDLIANVSVRNVSLLQI